MDARLHTDISEVNDMLNKYPLGFDTSLDRDSVMPIMLAIVDTPKGASDIAQALHVGEDIPDWLEICALTAALVRIRNGKDPHAIVDRFAPYFEYGTNDPHG